jgi:hypothetical protein
MLDLYLKPQARKTSIPSGNRAFGTHKGHRAIAIQTLVLRGDFPGSVLKLPGRISQDSLEFLSFAYAEKVRLGQFELFIGAHWGKRSFPFPFPSSMDFPFHAPGFSSKFARSRF